MSRILVVDDEDEVRSAICRRLSRDGHEVVSAENADAGEACLADTEAPFEAALQRSVFTEVIVLTAYGNVKNAVECMKLGAYDYVEKNIPDVDVYELLMLKIERALEQHRLTMRTAH